jgi:hypothetical protein
LEELETLERVFRSRGYDIVRSSRDNNYLLLSKSGSLLAVGYSMSPKKTTEGEAEMFISMGQNDSADSMLYISSMKLSKLVKKVFEKEGVDTWDRSALVMAIGEQVLNDWSRAEQEPKERSVMDLFDTEDVDPVKEVRKLHREVSSTEIGGFKIHEVEVGAVQTQEPEKSVLPPETRKKVAPKDKEPETVKEEPEIGFDLPMMPMMVDEPPKEESKEKPEAPKGQDHKVPEEILMDPWAGFEEHMEKTASSEKPPAKKEKKKDPSTGWKGATLAPEKYSNTDAISLAGGGEETELRKIHYPFLMLEATYTMIPEDGKDPIEQDGTYLYDCIRGEVFDVPGTVYDEVASIKDRWDGKEGPDKLTDPKADHNKAMVSLRRKIKSGRLAEDRKVSDTLMSTIYKEIEYKFDPRSLKLISSRRLMLPFWVKEGKRGKDEWAVNSYLGLLVK